MQYVGRTGQITAHAVNVDFDVLSQFHDVQFSHTVRPTMRHHPGDFLILIGDDSTEGFASFLPINLLQISWDRFFRNDTSVQQRNV